MVDDRGGAGRDARLDPPEAVVLAVNELAEALTALGNFATAAKQLTDDGKPRGDDVRKALAGASSQQERAGDAAHRLFQLLIPGGAEPRD